MNLRSNPVSYPECSLLPSWPGKRLTEGGTATRHELDGTVFEPRWHEISRPVLSGPVRSGPVRPGPVLSGPVLSGPVRSCPVLSGPVRSCPVRSCPVRSGPVMSGPVRSRGQTRLLYD